MTADESLPAGGPEDGTCRPGAILAGVRVLDMSRVLAGPWAAQLLSDFGAEVVKLERGTESIRGRFGRLPVHGAILGRSSRHLFPERTNRRPQTSAGRNRLAGTVRTPSSTKSRAPVRVTW